MEDMPEVPVPEVPVLEGPLTQLGVVSYCLPIVAIGSVATSSYPPGDALSAVPKAAIEMLCRAVAREEGRYGIRANVDEGLRDLRPS